MHGDDPRPQSGSCAFIIVRESRKRFLSNDETRALAAASALGRRLSSHLLNDLGLWADEERFDAVFTDCKDRGDQQLTVHVRRSKYEQREQPQGYDHQNWRCRTIIRFSTDRVFVQCPHDILPLGRGKFVCHRPARSKPTSLGATQAGMVSFAGICLCPTDIPPPVPIPAKCLPSAL